MSDHSSHSSTSTISSDDELSNERIDDVPTKRAKVVLDTSEKKAESESCRSSAAHPGRKLQEKWDEMFERLLQYKSEHGHCLVPNRYTEDPQLGSWVSTQRRQYKILTSKSDDATPMTPVRARQLEKIGFKWASKDPRHVPWELRYDELIAFKEKYGHSQVPIGWEENVKLSNWVSTQRQEYKMIQGGRQSRLSDEKIAQLDNLDFIWEAQRGGPRRTRKATVVVPSKPNPVDARKIKENAATRGGKAGVSVRGGRVGVRQSTRRLDELLSEHEQAKDARESDRREQFTIQQRQAFVDSANMIGRDTRIDAAALMHGAYAGVPGLEFGIAPQWQVLTNGALQPIIPQSMGLAGGRLIPLATQVQLARSEFQFGNSQVYPFLQLQQAAMGQLSAFQHQPQSASPIMPGSIGQLQLYEQGNVPHQS